MTDTFQQKRDEARHYEKALAAWFQHQFGAYILPTYDYSGLQDNKPPRLMGANDAFVIPDLLVTKSGRMTWVECKWKTHADLFRKTKTLCTGINARHWTHYQQVKKISGCDVVIMFLHIQEAEMRGDFIDTLKNSIHHTYNGGKMGYNGMVFWDYNKLKKWCPLSDVMKYKEVSNDNA